MTVLRVLLRLLTRPPYVFIPFNPPHNHQRCVCGHGEHFHTDGEWCHYCTCSYLEVAV